MSVIQTAEEKCHDSVPPRPLRAVGMKAFLVERYGDADAVRAGDVPDPQVGREDVLVRIHAASVNPLDLKIRDGDLKVILPYRTPFVLGNDLAGVIVGVGPGVTRFAVGDEVYARPRQDRIGAFAELIAMHQDDVAAKPRSEERRVGKECRSRWAPYH